MRTSWKRFCDASKGSKQARSGSSAGISLLDHLMMMMIPDAHLECYARIRDCAAECERRVLEIRWMADLEDVLPQFRWEELRRGGG